MSRTTIHTNSFSSIWFAVLHNARTCITIIPICYVVVYDLRKRRNDSYIYIYIDLPEIVDQTCNPATLNSLKLSCLLYADDIVLLSETAEGLQNSLDKVSQYCKKKWGIEINIDKTKSLVFNNTGRLFPVTFMIDNQLIENVKQYRYLGVMFNASLGASQMLKKNYIKEA